MKDVLYINVLSVKYFMNKSVVGLGGYVAPDVSYMLVAAEQGFVISEYGGEGEAGAPLEDIDNGIF